MECSCVANTEREWRSNWDDRSECMQVCNVCTYCWLLMLPSRSHQVVTLYLCIGWVNMKHTLLALALSAGVLFSCIQH